MAEITEVIPEYTGGDIIRPSDPATFNTNINYLFSYHPAFAPKVNSWATQANSLRNEVNEFQINAQNAAIVATSLANYQGEWSEIVIYSKSESVSDAGLYYSSKVDSNLNHEVTDTDYWLPNPINDKLNKDFSLLTNETTLSDTDIFPIQKTEGLLKKISWANLKATLKAYTDTLYIALTGDQTKEGILTFTSSPIVPIPTTTGNVITMDNIIQKTPVGVGYGAGAGGAVTQLTSKTTAVTLNKPTGKITTSNTAMAANSVAYFILNNNLIDLDTIVNCTSGNANYIVSATASISGAAYFRIVNISSNTLSDAINIQFNIEKGSNS